MNASVLVIPGLSNSGPDHWQSQWERARGDCVRVEQRDWETPSRADWVATLDAAVSTMRGPPVLVAHSTGCATVAHWAATARAQRRARGALLVAPSDPEAPSYPSGPSGFAPMPLLRLPFPAIVVASDDDEYVTPERAAEFAHAWGARLVNLGRAGHINGASGLGSWLDGQRLLEELLAPR
ncbi:MAG: alpha/beta hydrolase [Myxococcales bacterium]|nr:alpha/beta hydrolase [Myxococcales bacterium]